METPMAYVASAILCEAKEDDYVPGVATEITVETLHSSEVEGTEKLNWLALQSPTQQVNWGDGSRFYFKQFFLQSQKKGCNDRRYMHSGVM